MYLCTLSNDTTIRRGRLRKGEREKEDKGEMKEAEEKGWGRKKGLREEKGVKDGGKGMRARKVGV